MSLLSRIGVGLTVFILLIASLSLQAQFYNGSNMTFGKNRVQYRNFLWTYYRFADFDTYFYRNGSELAQFVAKYAHNEIPKMEDRLGITLDHKIQFIVFNKLTDLKQSNIGLAQNESYNTGGITHIVGSKVFIYFDGNIVHFENEISAAIAKVLFNQMMFGGSLGQQVKTSALFSLPDWFRIGFVSFASEDWNTDIDNRVRDGIVSGRYSKINNLTGDDAVYAGHSIWRFLALRYGKNTVSNIVRLVSISKSLEKGFNYVIGTSFSQVMSDWKVFYKNEYSGFSETHLPSGLVHLKYKPDRRTGQPRLSPNGKLLAYTTNERGKYKIFLLNLNTGKKKKIFKKGIMIDTKTDYSFPLLAWHPSGKLLAFVIEAKGLLWLYFYNLEDKTFDQRKIYDVQKITAMSYSDDGRFIVVSAIQKGQSDIFVYDIAANTFEKITNDLYSDLSPVFINHSKAIVFSSNRNNDTLDIHKNNQYQRMSKHFDLFLYDYVTGSRILKRLTQTPLADEIKPHALAYNTIGYLSDKSGIFNANIAIIDSTVSSVDTAVHYRYFVTKKTVSAYTRNIIDQQFSLASGKKTMLIYDDNKWKIFIDTVLNYADAPDLHPKLTRFMTSQLKKLKITVASGKTIAKKQQHKKNKPQLKQFRMVYFDGKGGETIVNPKAGRKGGGGFFSGLEGYEDKNGNFIIPKQLNYNTQYNISNVISQMDFNYINYNYQPFTGGGPIYLNPGFNLFTKIGVTDLMEDHRIVGGVRFNFSLINNEYVFSYANLTNRLDKEVVFHRNTLQGVNDNNIYEIHSNELYYILKWPFNEALSLRGTVQYRNNMFVTLATDQQALETPTTFENWIGYKTELVFDGTRNVGMNLYYGSRWKIFAEYNQLLFKGENRDLIVLGFDFRHYLKIHRTFIWANRIAGSTSLGTDRLIYYMGGVDNWFFPKFNNNTPIDLRQHYAYQTLATNMRGFYQNIRNGNSFFVINSELRFPVFQYFSQMPLSSSFLRNFQIVAFGDIGTAWTGVSPYSRNNSLFTNYVNSGPLHITVEVQKEPIVGGFGAGLRVQIFGYFVRGDMAWGVEDFHIRKPVFYLSLSLDF